jgi:hypothetical protein
MATFNIVEFILMDLLQISSDLLRDYSSTQEQLLYLFLIPHAVLLLFVYMFAGSISSMAIRGPQPHKGFRVLFGIVAYITIIFSGWYGNLLVPIFILWWQMALVVALILFSMSKLFIDPASLQDVAKAGAAVSSKLGEKGRSKKKIQKELRLVNEQITRVTPLAATGNFTHQNELARLEAKRAQLEAGFAALD